MLIVNFDIAIFVVNVGIEFTENFTLLDSNNIFSIKKYVTLNYTLLFGYYDLIKQIDLGLEVTKG